jgi:hypothetical protein
MSETDAALAQKRAHGSVSDENLPFQQFFQVEAQKDPSPSYYTLARRREASSL